MDLFFLPLPIEEEEVFLATIEGSDGCNSGSRRLRLHAHFSVLGSIACFAWSAGVSLNWFTLFGRTTAIKGASFDFE